VYIFRGKAATGKSTLANLLSKELSVAVICKDDVVDALKTTSDIDNNLLNNAICYNILQRIIQTNLDLGVDLILDVALGDRKNATWFFNRLDFKGNRVVKFFTVCSDDNEWQKRHFERISNPLPHQSFKSFEHVVEHYKSRDVNPFEDEHIVDTSNSIERCFGNIIETINAYKATSE
jgi:hypothetical protein